MTDKAHPRRDFDNLFKTILREYFWEGLKIFLPELYEAADRNIPVEFLDKELQKVTFDLESGAKRVDMIAKITLKSGAKEFLICHLELQGKSGGNLPDRMMFYRDAIHLMHKKEPVGIAVLLTNRPRGEKAFYCSNIYGVEVTYKYIKVLVPDIADETLLADESRIGLVLYAAKCVNKSGGNEGEKLRYLRHVSDLWNERGWSPHDKRITLEAIGYLIGLSDKDYIRQAVEYVENLQMNREDREMYVSIFEEVYTERGMKKGVEKGMERGMKEGMERGRKEGMERGRKEGVEKGRNEAKKEIAKNFLAEGTPPEIVAKNTGLSLDNVRSLMD
jgi:hypothetical protein